MDFKQVISNIRQARRQQILDFEQKKLDFLAADKIYYDIETQIRDIEFSLAENQQNSKCATDIFQTTEKINELKAARENYEKSHGITPPPFKCTLCHDTGINKGRFCSCVIAAAINSTDNINIPLHDYSESNFKLFEQQNAARLEKLFKDFYYIIDNYPRGSKKVLMLIGSAGTGKTFLCGCAAKHMLEKNESVIALTSFAINNRFLKYHTTFDNGKSDYLDPLLDCSLLIIDDLGTESILKNVTKEYLYQVINERTLSKKLTIISTNLKLDGILTRYGERIYSRLFDKSLNYTNIIINKDLRSIF